MQSPKDSAPAVAAAQVPVQSGAADETREASQPTSSAREPLPPSSPSSVASSSSSFSSSSSSSTSKSSSPGDGEEGTPSAEAAAAGGCVFASRVRSLPAVQALLGAYAGAKAYPVVGWALAVGEQVASLATVVCRPVNLVCRTPISCGDWCLCKALDIAESVFPCISMPPSKVYYGAQECVVNCVCWPTRAAAKCLAKGCPCF